jgi:hypothetical protein
MKGKSWIFYAVGIAVLIVLSAVIFNQCSDKKNVETELKKSCDAVALMDDLNARNKSLVKENAKLNWQNDSLQGLVNGLTRALADCQGKKPIPPVAKNVTKKIAVAPPKKTEPTKVTPTPIVAVVPEPKKEDFSAEKAALLKSVPVEPEDDGTMYDPIFEGDAGNTLYDNGYLAFYLSDKLFKSYGTIEAPQFNIKGGAPFVKEGEYWVYRSRIKGKIGGYMNWCTYAGKNSEYNFDMFLPHEWQKKGGSEVKALIKAGSIRPNGNTKADGVTEGWEFYLPVRAKAKTGL